MSKRVSVWAVSGVLCLVVAGCGGDDSDANGPVSLFPLQGALQARMQTGATENFNISGACHGTAKIVTSPAVAATFEGSAARSLPQSITYNFTDCVPATSVVAGAAYYDASAGLLGDITNGQEYSKVTSTIRPMPLLVAVGDEVEYARLTVYNDIGKATVMGRRTQTYRVDADGPRSAFVTLTARAYDVADVLLYTEAIKYRVTADRGMTMVGIDAQYGVGPAGRFVYTPVP